ncbi:MAG: hypothetical protein R3240_03615, partial [Gammaproteobacteria bacterium]|nr:hypothetical protein [Gammaproteobacteria bacterium]
MQSLDPKTVELKDSLNWFKQSFDLVGRRPVLYALSVISLFGVLFFATQSINSISETSSPIVVSLLLLVFSAFAFFFILAKLILLSHCSDHSHHYNLASVFASFIPNQKVFFKMSMLAVTSGFFFWYLSLLAHP